MPAEQRLFDGPSSSDDDLTDEQQQQLLREAAARLRAKAGCQSQKSLPRKSSNVKPFVNANGRFGPLDADSNPRKQPKQHVPGMRKVNDPVVVKQDKIKAKKATAGPDWYNLPRTDLTPGLKQDLQLLKMRNVLDPHRHYKKDNSKPAAPEFSQVGTIVEGPTEFFSARLNQAERYESFADEVLAGEKGSGRFKQKYGEIQDKTTSGKKGHYKALMAKRSKKFKR